MIKLNVGCGPDHLREGWVNMDIRPFKGVDYVRDATQPFDDLGPFNYIYSEHFLEHLTLEGALKFLKNCMSAMETGGKLRLSTPALEWVLTTHYNLSETDSDKIITSTFGINRAFHGWGHEFLWSASMLERSLSAVGFKEIVFCEAGKSNEAALEEIELHPGYRRVGNLSNCHIVEATKVLQTPIIDDDFFARAENEFCRYVRSAH